MDLNDLGWNARLTALFTEHEELGFSPARVSLESRAAYRIITEVGEMPAALTGKLLYASEGRDDLPVVGDWVAASLLDETPRRAVIHGIVPRKSLFARKQPGSKVKPQPVAANVDVALIAVGLDGNFSLRRIERYLALAWESGAMPVVLLTKADLCGNLEENIRAAEEASPGTPVHAVSAVQGLGLDQLDAYMRKGHTLALLGSSGVGKSTLINYLLGGDVQRVTEVRAFDSKGRHTTSNRQLFVTPSGAMVIDTPGMRELQLWNASDGLSETFREIEELATGCRFADCTHGPEPGCVVREALGRGEIDPSRMENYLRMQRELDHLARKQDTSAAAAERSKWKHIHKEIRRFKKG